MQHPPLNRDEILGGRRIKFINRDETKYPKLMRLSMDFDLCVLQLQRTTYSHLSKQFLPADSAFVLTERDYRTNNITYSPLCSTLRELEAYAQFNHVDILHEFLFGSSQLENML